MFNRYVCFVFCLLKYLSHMYALNMQCVASRNKVQVSQPTYTSVMADSKIVQSKLHCVSICLHSGEGISSAVYDSEDRRCACRHACQDVIPTLDDTVQDPVATG